MAISDTSGAYSAGEKTGSGYKHKYNYKYKEYSTADKSGTGT